jgi:hypothetical protein
MGSGVALHYSCEWRWHPLGRHARPPRSIGERPRIAASFIEGVIG